VARGLHCQLPDMARRHVTSITLAIACWFASAHAAGAYSVTVRWAGSDDATIAGYHVYVNSAGAPERGPIDVELPERAGDESFAALVDGLDVETTYTFSIAAYSTNGQESPRSNSYTIGYAQAAQVVDSDHDGLTDAQEDRNLNMIVDPGETDPHNPDTDGDGVPDGIEVGYGSDPLTPGSPVCSPLDFATFGTMGRGTAAIVDDAGEQTMVTTVAGSRATGFGVVYPRRGRAQLTDPLLVTHLQGTGGFSIDVKTRSVDGKFFRMRYVNSGTDRIQGRRLTRVLENDFSLDTPQTLGFNLAADMARLDPNAVFAAIERITVRGGVVLGQLRTCR